MEQKNKEVFFNDISKIEGIYSDFVLLKSNELVSLIRVEGINLDLLSEYEQNRLFEDYGAFLMQDYDFGTVSMTVPLDIRQYNLYWKKLFLNQKELLDNKKTTTEAEEHLKQLKASYGLYYQDIELSADLTTKQHTIVITEKILKRTIKHLKEAELNMREKIKVISNSLENMLESYDTSLEVLSATDTIRILHRFIDFKASMYA